MCVIRFLYVIKKKRKQGRAEEEEEEDEEETSLSFSKYNLILLQRKLFQNQQK